MFLKPLNVIFISISYNLPSMTASMDSNHVSAGTSIRRIANTFALIATCAFGVSLGVRTLSNADLGYHLAYGDSFLDNSRIVDTNDFIYTLPVRNPDTELNQPGPGCWYDESGKYRFPNANWLSQIIMSAVNHVFGSEGLSILQAVLVAGIFAACLAAMKRLKIPALWASLGILLIGFVAYGRFTLRPEVFGYLILAIQLAILAGGKMKWKSVISLIILQLLLVNLHSYFLLGLGLTGAFVADKFLRYVWNRIRKSEPDKQLNKSLTVFAITLAGQLTVCFINPWGWRLAVLPIQTLIFLRQNNIVASQTASIHGHPWSLIGELFSPFASNAAFVNTKSTYAFCVFLGISGIGIVWALIKKKWAWLLVMAALTAVSLSMRRNIAFAAILATPLALGACFSLYRTFVTESPAKKPSYSSISLIIVSAVVIVFSGYFIFTVVTHRFYYNERSPLRFGLGNSELNLPIGPARWLTQHKPQGQVWTSFNSSSNIYYFTQPHPQVPVLTNTWAYPPGVLQEVLEVSRSTAAFESAVKRYSIQTVAIRTDITNSRLLKYLDQNPKWSLVFLDAWYCVFIDNTGPNAELAKRFNIRKEAFDVADYSKRLAEVDPMNAYSLNLGSMTLFHLGWYSPAIEILNSATKIDPSYHKAWILKGWCLTHRAIGNFEAGAFSTARKDFNLARESLLAALRIKPNYKPAKNSLLALEEDMRRLNMR